ncbi:MAG: molybdopterin converting factor subunit 1 [Sulfurihydrogenibium sp.]|uniref:molybdopterin converting factor subunit 1 n=1 Tax=Sulfurihydrogenibium sp. TaxID=2053621 RepID=UPI000CBEC12B|nr:MAG: molybdopterin converting factor subunit 1 [Sulfurihydrogenibium sp.]
MKVEILYFSQIKDKVGKSSEVLEFTGNTVSDLVEFLAQKYPNAKDVLEKSMFAVNEEYVDKQAILKEGDKIAIIPPVSGG